jgi:hypothetical protein
MSCCRRIGHQRDKRGRRGNWEGLSEEIAKAPMTAAGALVGSQTKMAAGAKAGSIIGTTLAGPVGGIIGSGVGALIGNLYGLGIGINNPGKTILGTFKEGIDVYQKQQD